MAKRKIIKIDENKCNGCGLCIPNCHEGAIQIIDGKARLISDASCDGLGACLGHCPEGAITIEEREAEEYGERKSMEKIAKRHDHMSGGCPGSKSMEIKRTGDKKKVIKNGGVSAESRLSNWPVQITLVPPDAPYFNGADILIAADCVPFAYAGFHNELLKGRILLVGCPKLDDIGMYKDKICQIVKNNDVKSITYAHMEVPCCFGLVDVIKEAMSGSGKDVPFKETVISIKGEKLR